MTTIAAVPPWGGDRNPMTIEIQAQDDGTWRAALREGGRRITGIAGIAPGVTRDGDALTAALRAAITGEWATARVRRLAEYHALLWRSRKVPGRHRR